MRGVVAGVALLAIAGSATADEPKKLEGVKKAIIGKWESTGKEKIPLELYSDGTIKVPSYGNGKWSLVDGTYTVDESGEIRYRAAIGKITLGGWFKLKDGMLTSAKGPLLIVTWKKVAEEKAPERN